MISQITRSTEPSRMFASTFLCCRAWGTGYGSGKVGRARRLRSASSVPPTVSTTQVAHGKRHTRILGNCDASEYGTRVNLGPSLPLGRGWRCRDYVACGAVSVRRLLLM